MTSAFLPLRFALRDLRGGLRGFFVLLAVVALGVAAIVAVGATARGVAEGVAAGGRKLVGGDIAFSQATREANAQELAFLQARGAVSAIAQQRSMARFGDRSTLVEIKAVDAAWPDHGGRFPELGQAEFAPPQTPAQALSGGAAPRIAAEAALFAKFGIEPGATIRIGERDMILGARLASEPDKLAAALGFGPRVLMSIEALRGSGLVQPGSLTRWTYRLAMPAGATSADAQKVADDFAAAFPEAGFPTRRSDRASPEFDANVSRFSDFLTLVGLTALVVGGVGAANASAAFVQRKRADMATLKSLGASGGRVVAIALTQVMLIAALAALIGATLGAAAPFAVTRFFRDVLPLPLEPAIYPREMALGAFYGLLATFAFSIASLGRAHDAPVAALFRDTADLAPRAARRRYRVMAGLAFAALIAAAALFAGSARLALIYALATAAAFLALRGVAALMMALARRAPRPKDTPARLALSNIHRPGALTPSVVLSLGLGLTLLVALGLVQANVGGQLSRSVSGRTPSFFFLDLNTREAGDFARFVEGAANGARLERVPMMRGRIVKVKDTPSEQVKASEDSEWALRGDRGVTYSAALPEGSTLTRGGWWAKDYSGPPLVSMEQGVARGLGLDVGDSVTVNVLGRNVTATIANLRQVDWRSFGINFVLVFSPNAFRGAPHTELATISFPTDIGEARELALLKAVNDAFPTVTALRVREALEAAREMVDKLAGAVRAAASIAVVASILVLAGALSAGREARVYDAVVLKSLGATRRQLALAYFYEYAGMGLATALFGVAAGTAAAWAAAAKLMKMDFVFAPGAALTALALALALTVSFGFLGAWRVFGESPARRLRTL